MTTFDAKTVWAEYQKGVSYKTQLGLYERCASEDFYAVTVEGRERADLPKPTLNMPAVVAYFNAMIVSDDVAIRFALPDPSLDKTCALLSRAQGLRIHQSPRYTGGAGQRRSGRGFMLLPVVRPEKKPVRPTG